MNLPISRCGVSKELQDALADTQHAINQQGVPVTFRTVHESELTRSGYESVKVRARIPTIDVYAFVEFSPSQQRLDKVGIYTDVDALITTASKDWTDAGYTFPDVDPLRWRVEIQGVSYEIADKKQRAQMATGYLYYVFGVKKI